MRWAKGMAAVLALAGTSALAQEVQAPDLGPEYPPKMGEIAGTLGKVPVSWETFDFSVGAFDGSAWMGYWDDQFRLSLMGYPKGEPETMAGRILIRAYYPTMPVAGAVPDMIEVIIPDGDKLSGPRMSSKGEKAEIVITAISRDSRSYGRLAGQATARVCPRGGKTGTCRTLTVNFETSLQYDSVPEG